MPLKWYISSVFVIVKKEGMTSEKLIYHFDTMTLMGWQAVKSELIIIMNPETLQDFMNITQDNRGIS